MGTFSCTQQQHKISPPWARRRCIGVQSQSIKEMRLTTPCRRLCTVSRTLESPAVTTQGPKNSAKCGSSSISNARRSYKPNSGQENRSSRTLESSRAVSPQNGPISPQLGRDSVSEFSPMYMGIDENHAYGEAGSRQFSCKRNDT